MAMKKGILHIELVDRLGAGDGQAEDDPYGGRFDNRTEGLIVVDAVLLREPANNPPALCRAREPSEWYLCLKIHLSETTLVRGGRGTSRQVPLSMSALYSSTITAHQFGSARALR